MSCSDAAAAAASSSNPPEQLVMPPRRRVQVPQGMCVKCRTNKARIARLSLAYCHACFKSTTYIRFAKNLNTAIQNPTRSLASTKPKLGRPPLQPGQVLVPVSGGAGGLGMLDYLLDNFFVGTHSVTGAGNGTGIGTDAGTGTGIGTDAGKEQTARERGRKYTWEHCYVLYVDFSDILPLVTDQTTRLRAHVDSYRSPTTFISLKIQDVYDPTLIARLRRVRAGDVWVRDEDGEERMGGAEGLRVGLGRADLPILTSSSPASSPLPTLISTLSTIPASSHPHILQTLLDELINTVSLNLPDISQVLLGETSTRQAVSIISGSAIGKGWSLGTNLSLAHHLGSNEARRGVTRIKPMRDIMIKEAAFHCRLRGIETVDHRGWDTFTVKGKKERRSGAEARGKGGWSSLEKLTEDFIFNLDVNHPSTVSTISRTGSKLVFKGYGKEDEVSERERRWGICPFCGCPEEPSSLEWKARTALTSLGKPDPSSSPSTNADPATAPDPEEAVRRTMHDGSVRSTDHLPGTEGLAGKMCYACLTAFSNASPGTTRSASRSDLEQVHVELPYWVRERVRSGHPAREGMGREEMKEVIGEFLIEDEEETVG